MLGHLSHLAIYEVGQALEIPTLITTADTDAPSHLQHHDRERDGDAIRYRALVGDCDQRGEVGHPVRHLLAGRLEPAGALSIAGAKAWVNGVVTDTDLMGIGRNTPFALKSAIDRGLVKASAGTDGGAGA